MNVKKALAWYDKNWPKIGAVGSTALAGLLAARGTSMSRTRAFAVANLATLGAHQFEEHTWPGYFAGVFNRYVLGSDTPATEPVDARTATVINTVMAYPFAVAPVLFPNARWLALGNAFFGFTQTLGHCLAMPVRSKVPYVPGAVTAAGLYAPVGAAWIREHARADGPLTRSDVAKGLACAAAFAVVGVVGPRKALANATRHPAQPYQVTVPAWNHVDALEARLSGEVPGPVRTFMRHWYDVNGVVGVGAIAAVGLLWNRLSPAQRIMLGQFAVMNLHHAEEFGYPGGFPAMANGLQLHSRHPDRHPLNQANCCFGNNWFNYAVYLPAVVLDATWLRLSVTFFGFVELLMHGVFYTRLTRHPYNAGLATSVLGFAPLSAAYLRWAYGRGRVPVSGWDRLRAVAYPVGSYLVVFRLIVMRMLATTETRFPFTTAEMERVKRSLPGLTDADLYPADSTYPLRRRDG